MSTAEYKRQFRANQSINPETGRSITIGGEKYKELVKKYGKNKSPRRSPLKTRKTPTKKSPLRRSPLKTQRSPIRRTNLYDPFEVLSDESIMRVLSKLSDKNRLLWINSSPKVKAVYNSMSTSQ